MIIFKLYKYYYHFRGEYRDDPNERRSMVRSVSTGGGYSGTGYDQSVKARAAASGPGSTDTPLNKLQYKYWVTKSKVVRKFGKEEDECITLSDAQLDAKLELYKSIHSSTQDLCRILDQYNDRLCSKYHWLLFINHSYCLVCHRWLTLLQAQI